MAEKLVTREPGSRWVPHPAFRHRLGPRCVPLTPSPPAPEERRGRCPQSAASFSLGSAWRPRAPTARASRRTRERETRRPARGAQRRPLPSWPLPSPTSTAPAPHPRDPPGAARQPPGYTTRPATGGGGPRAGGAPAVQGEQGDRRWGSRAPGSAAPGAPRHPSPSAPQWAGVGDRNRLPTWRTGSGPARRREHSSRAGSGGSGPGEPASGGATGSSAQKGHLGMEMTRETRGPNHRPPPERNPQGHRWA